MNQKCTGIIIDDDVDIRDELSTYLENYGFDIIGNGINGCQADQLFKEKKPDFVVLDLNMPDYDGKYAIEKIKEQDPQAKIFIITGCTDCSFEESKIEAVFEKPFNMTQFRNTICKSVYS